MILLDATTKSLEVLLGAGVVTQVPIVANWVDLSTASGVAVSGISDTTTVSNNTTAVTAVAAPGASTTRQIKFLSVRNLNTSAVTVKVQVNNGGTKRVIVAVSLSLDDTLTYMDGRGVQVQNANGEQKASSVLINLTSQVTGTLPVANGGTGDATLTAHGVLVGNGTSGVNATAVGTTGQVLTGVTGADPTWQSPAGGTVDNTVVGFRLTLTSGLAVTLADVTGATTVYCTPHKGNRIALYDGAAWNLRTSAEFGLALGTLTSGLPYDVFCYDNAGTPTLEFLAWTSGTARATALVRQDGVLSKTGALTRRYLGTFYTTSTTATEDSDAKRFLWNYYNREERRMLVAEAAGSWTYTTATWRQANGAAANKLQWVTGFEEDPITVSVGVQAANSSANVLLGLATAFDATNAPDTEMSNVTFVTQVANQAVNSYVSMQKRAGVGYHFAAWVEFSAATGTTTWTGSGNHSSITGKVIG